jgi:hypothetical protein
MKKILLIALFAAFGVQAETVTVQASGTGDTCKQALVAAKRAALDKANGSFLYAVERDDNGKYTANIEEYSGGVVKSYKYLRDDCTFVIIEAEVERRSNIVQLTGVDLDKGKIVHIQGMKDAQDQKQKAVKLLDNRRDAVYFKKTDMSMQLVDDVVGVTLSGTFALKDKWKSDYKDLREMYGWFNLPSFAEDAAVLVTGIDRAGKPVFTRTIHRDWKAGGEWNIWKMKSWGVNRVVDVRIHETDPIKLKFGVKFEELERVEQFMVEVI